MNNEITKGFNDYTGEKAQKRAELKKILIETFEKYGFEPAETPIIESEEFVKGDNPSDEAISDIYKLKDKGKRKLALRYEFTFQLKRLMQNKKLPYKRYQIGEVFRDEPMKGNRTRQFTTCEADIVGSTIKEEAEILSMASSILNKLSVKFTILINNRRLLNEILEDLKIKNKEQVLRELDKLDKQGPQKTQDQLSKIGAKNLLESISQGEEYFSKFESYKEIISLMEYCKAYNVKVLFSPSLARGLSYYNGTIFEIKTKKIKETICGGGSYKFNNIQSTGFGVSLERLEILTDIKYSKEKYLIISLDRDRQAIKLAQQLREKDKIVSVYYGKPSKALEFANSYNYNKVIFVGEDEVKSGKYKVKDMVSGRVVRIIKLNE